MKIVQIISPRPNLVKFINITGKDVVINTGQHYSDELKAYKTDISYNINLTELGDMVRELMPRVKDEKPNLVIVYGDNRSTLAGALVADQLNIPLAHIEAGVRLGDMTRPEERIRRMIDHVSDFLFCINDFHAENLEREDVKGRIYIVGDLHYDRYLEHRPHMGYIAATIHRAENTDDKGDLRWAIGRLNREEDVYFLVHPRTKKMMAEFKIKVPKNVKVLEPVKYEDMLKVIRWAKLVITDSGGVAREAYFSGVPVEFVGKSEWETEVGMFGDGKAGEKIRKIILEEVLK